jgi:hypothetical protein
MLRLIESQQEKVQAQEKLLARLKKAWPSREKRIVAWRPDSVEMRIYHNGQYWSGSFPPKPRDKTPRYWTPFGEYRESGVFHIAVEINVPTTTNTKRTKGFFARDTETSRVYLMHDGGVGGGQKGVGKWEFLRWSDLEVVPVVDSQGETRLGIVVAPIDSQTTADDISHFVQKVIDFKHAVRSGEVGPVTPSERRTYKDYYDEFAGRKRRRRIAEMEYISRHGQIVTALHDWRQRHAKSNGKIVKNAYVDLGIENTHGVLKEIYEVKTNCDRQTLYSAIGQILVHDHSRNGTCQRFVVLPKGDQIPEDVRHAFTRSNISVLHFNLKGDKIQILAQ